MYNLPNNNLSHLINESFPRHWLQWILHVKVKAGNCERTKHCLYTHSNVWSLWKGIWCLCNKKLLKLPGRSFRSTEFYGHLYMSNTTTHEPLCSLRWKSKECETFNKIPVRVKCRMFKRFSEKFWHFYVFSLRLEFCEDCGLVVRVFGYRYRCPGFDPRRYQIFWVVVGLERGPLSLVSLVRSIEELLEWKK